MSDTTSDAAEKKVTNAAISVFLAMAFVCCLAAIGAYQFGISRTNHYWRTQLLEKRLMYYHPENGDLYWTPLANSKQTFNDVDSAAIFAFENDPTTNKENFQKAIQWNNSMTDSAIVIDNNTVKVVRSEKQD